MVSTAERLALLAPICAQFPELGVRNQDDLEAWVTAELGRVDALEVWQDYASSKTRAVAPGSIAHILAGNLPVSGLQSLLVGLVLGAQNVVKLPTEKPGHSPVSDRLHAFAAALPEPLHALVSFHASLEDEELRATDGVIAHGSDEAMAALHAKVRWDQRFLAYGHKLSLIWMTEAGGQDEAVITAAARDISTYDQYGCLSPQCLFLAPGLHASKGAAFCEKLAAALATEAETNPPAPHTAGEAAQLREARDTAAALGARLWTPQDRSLAWTVVWKAESEFAGSPGGRFIHVRPAETANLPNLLRPLHGKISTVGIGGELDSVTRAVFLALGLHRFCPVGEMQRPPVWWHHDGQPQLAPLVTWVDSAA